MTIHGKTGVEVGDMAANVDPNSGDITQTIIITKIYRKPNYMISKGYYLLFYSRDLLYYYVR